jgi:protein SCO1/2
MKHSHPHPPHAIAAAATLASCLFATSARAQKYREGDAPIPATMAPELTGVDIVEHLNGQLPRDAVFKDTDGKMVKLGDFFDGKRPTLFVFAYHTCPMLCSLVLDATIKSLNDVNWTVGDEFDVVSLSIDPRDTPESATRKRDQVVGSYKRAKGDPRGFHFLVGDETNIRRVTDAIGFEYRYDERQKQYAHPAAIYLLSPEGKVERYLYGISYEPGEVRLGLLEATQGRSISTTERILLYCYHYDPQQKRYTLIAMRVMRLGGVATLAAFGSFFAVMWARERRKKKAADGAGPAPRDASPATTAPSAQATHGSDPAAGAHSS